MAYKCLRCNRIFNEPEEDREYRGFVGGDCAYESMSKCPHCGGAFVEVGACVICGEQHTAEELHSGVCSACIDDKRNDFPAIYNISLGETKAVEINELIATLLDEADINQILYDYIRRNMVGVDCSEYIDDDIDFIAEGLAEGRDKL